MMITPAQFLAMVLLVTAAAGLVRVIVRRRHVQQLRMLAAKWKMHFSADDRFRLATRIAPRLPVPGAAGIRVADLLYGIEDENYRYVFAAEYTTGVLRTKTGCGGSRPSASRATRRRTKRPSNVSSNSRLRGFPSCSSIDTCWRSGA